MTRRAKCDWCRKTKIKCDECLPSCGGCIRKGRECTHTAAKKEFRFVEVQGQLQVVEDNAAFLAPRKKAIMTTVGKRKGLSHIMMAETTDQRVMTSASPDHLARHPAVLLTPLPREPCHTPEVAVLARWAHSMVHDWEGAHPSDGLGTWSPLVARYIGCSAAVAASTRALLESTAALALREHPHGKEEAYAATRRAYVAAVRSLRVAVEERTKTGTGSGGRQPPFTGDLLLAAYTLFVVEFLVCTAPGAAVSHATGVSNLYSLHASYNDGSETEKALSAAMLHTVASSGIMPAILAGRNHELDNPAWLDRPYPQGHKVRIPGLSVATTVSTLNTIKRTTIRIPRLVCLVRELLRASTADHDESPSAAATAAAAEAGSLVAEMLSITAATIALVEAQAAAAGALRTTRAASPAVRPATEESYAFSSTNLCVIFTVLWTLRAWVLGAAAAALPYINQHHRSHHHGDGDCGRGCWAGCRSSLLISAEALAEYEVETAEALARCVEWPLQLRRTTIFGGEDTRVLMVLKTLYGVWRRIGARRAAAAAAAADKVDEEHERKAGEDNDEDGSLAEHSRFMMAWCLNLSNDITAKYQRPKLCSAIFDFACDVMVGAKFGSERPQQE